MRYKVKELIEKLQEMVEQTPSIADANVVIGTYTDSSYLMVDEEPSMQNSWNIVVYTSDDCGDLYLEEDDN